MKTKDLRDRIAEMLRQRLMNYVRLRHPEMSPRRWSNAELRRVAPFVEGDVVNVSGWRDADKEGNSYRSYFTKAKSYAITNYWGSREANDGAEGSIFLDLQAELPNELHARYDTVLCHTVLEHIYDVPKAVNNVCEMTKDLAILIVPFVQDEHYTNELYGDFWRFTPLSLKRLTGDAGLQLLYINSNDNPWYPVYLFAVASRMPERWAGRFGGPYDWSKRIGRDIFIFDNCAW
jgi:hypothetical protein